MSDKTFTLVGVSTNAKQTKFRVANGDVNARIKVLERNGHTDIKMVELPSPMTKMDAIEAFKKAYPEFNSVRMPNDKSDATNVKTLNLKKAKDVGTAVLSETNESEAA